MNTHRSQQRNENCKNEPKRNVRKKTIMAKVVIEKYNPSSVGKVLKQLKLSWTIRKKLTRAPLLKWFGSIFEKLIT